MVLSLLRGTGEWGLEAECGGVDGKKFAAGCIKAVLNGIDL